MDTNPHIAKQLYRQRVEELRSEAGTRSSANRRWQRWRRRLRRGRALAQSTPATP